VDKEIEEYPFGYFLATLNGDGRNSYRETHGRYIPSIQNYTYPD